MCLFGSTDAAQKKLWLKMRYGKHPTERTTQQGDPRYICLGFDIRNVEASVGFASDVDLLVVETKGVHEVGPEASELLCYLFFVGGGWRASL